MKYIVEIKVEYNKALFKFDTAKEAFQYRKKRSRQASRADGRNRIF